MDASLEGILGILKQVGINKIRHSIAYFSRKLKTIIQQQN